jgi:hypothetical protein
LRIGILPQKNHRGGIFRNRSYWTCRTYIFFYDHLNLSPSPGPHGTPRMW